MITNHTGKEGTMALKIRQSRKVGYAWLNDTDGRVYFHPGMGYYTRSYDHTGIYSLNTVGRLDRFLAVHGLSVLDIVDVIPAEFGAM